MDSLEWKHSRASPLGLLRSPRLNSTQRSGETYWTTTLYTMSDHPSKRKSPPPAASPTSKRQRLSPSQAHLPSLGQHSTTASPRDSLSSLSPTNSRASSPASTSQPPLPPPPNPPATNPGDEYGDEDGEGEDDDDEDEDDDMEEVVAPAGHHVHSAKTVPSKQPRPLLPATGAKTNGAPGRGGGGAVGGKGRKGEEALEHAVAAREEVERRRVELKAAPGGGGAGTAGAKGVKGAAAAEPKVKEEEEEVIVVHGEEAEEIAAPVRSRLQLPVAGAMHGVVHADPLTCA